jgi:hypothetical protein
MLISIEEAMYLFLTVLIPLNTTYISIHYRQREKMRLWAVYWSFYFGFKALQWNIEALQCPPVDFVFVGLAVWMYNASYKVNCGEFRGRFSLPSL